ncbi:class I SAM-dependent DNA methyltransferase [Tolypothrix sp. VBCCA 56010]|uniref:class I SAM-dependent DNA methyltransferase n=1 Tax=Tolypothrix sp. VBCCA 56010 TaxID=3137731 RepID=UPI003D7C6491
MSSKTLYSAYNSQAWLYNKQAPEIVNPTLPQVEKLLLSHLPEEAHILDLGCGTGQLAQHLLIKGYKVTGLDGSEEMLHFARENAPGGKFLVADARYFEFLSIFDAVVSTNAVLNYVMSLEELRWVFRNVHTALVENGLFVFNLDTEEAYQKYVQAYLSGDVKDEYAYAELQRYDPEDKINRRQLTIFNLVEGNWQRSDTTLLEKCYSTSEIQSALENVGFAEVNIYDSERDLGIPGEAGYIYCVCRKRLNT